MHVFLLLAQLFQLFSIFYFSNTMSRTLVVLALLFCVTTHQTKANTVLDTIIGSSTTWNLANSPYLAKTDVVIPKTITVRVEPGVEVKFAPKKALKVKGTLLAEVRFFFF